MNIGDILLSYIIFPGFIFTAVVGLFITWIDRKVTARIHWRVGPPWFQCLEELNAGITVCPRGQPPVRNGHCIAANTFQYR